MPPFPDITPPAMGTVFSAAVSPGASGDVNAKLRTLTQQNDDIKALLAAIYLSDTPQITGIVAIEGDLGTADDPASSPGGPGSVNAKLRLETAQLDQIAFLLTEIATGTTTTALPTPLAVSGTVTVLPGAVPWIVGLPDGNDVCEGATSDAAATVGGSGTLSAKLRLVTQQLEDIKLLLAETSGSSVSAVLPNPIGVSGLVAVSGALLVNQGAPGSQAWPVSIDAPLAVSGTMTVLQGTDPWNVVFPQPVAVSGNLTSTVSIPTPLAVSGTVFLGNTPTVFVQGPVGVSGTLSATVVLPNPIGVSGTVTVLQGPGLWNVSFPQPIAVSGALTTTVTIPTPLGVSGTISIGNVPDVNAHLSLPIGVSGTLSANVIALPLPLGVSGTVSANVIALPLPVGISGTISIGNVPTVLVQGPVAVSGNVSVLDLGSAQDLAAIGDISGSVNAHLRGLDAILADVWDTTGHELRVTTAPLTGVTVNVTLTTATITGQASSEVVLIPLGTYAATASSINQINTNFDRMAVIVHVQASTGTIAVSPSLQIQDSISANYFTVWTAAATLTASGTYAYYFGDGGSGGGSSWTEMQAFGIPAKTWRFVMGHANGSSVLYSVSAAELAVTITNIGLAATITTSGAVASAISPTAGILIDHSGTITSGSISQQMVPANLSRKYLFIENLDLSNPLWVDFTAAAALDQPSIRIGVGSSFTMESSFVSTEAVNATGPVTGQSFVVKEA